MTPRLPSHALPIDCAGTKRLARYAQLLGMLGLAFFIVWARLGPGDIQLGNKGDDMWVKILGLVCVGVFVGAALVEARQLRQRKKEVGRELASERQDTVGDQQGDEDLSAEKRG